MVSHPVSCELCTNSAQVMWRVVELENNMKLLYKILVSLVLLHVGTLAGVITILVTR